MLLFTDGITEAMVGGKRFGTDGLAAAFSELAANGQDSGGILKGIMQNVEGVAQQDDVTMMAVRYVPQAGRLTMQAHLQLSFEPMWPNVREIRERVGSALQDCPHQLRSAAIMTSSELVENAIKYGESVPAAQDGDVRARGDAGSARRIRVVNGSTNALGVAELQRRVQELHRAGDKRGALPRAARGAPRRRRARAASWGSTASDSKGDSTFELDYTNHVVTVTATRKANA